MPKHETECCPRCGILFECKVGDVMNCQCSQVVVSPKTYLFLEETEYGCLCKNCLSDIDRMVLMAEESVFPSEPSNFVENVHYYIDAGLWVFTEFYHLSRGYCCGNHCRHCAYGNKKKRP